MALDLESAALGHTPKFRNFDWEKAKTFYYVAKLGSFVSAARALNISQSALSRKIIYLEQHLECPLFSRHSGGVKLTRKGEELFAIVEQTFIGFKGFTQDTHAKTANGKKRKIRIATTHALASYVFGDLVLEYNKNHPHLIFELIGEDHSLDIFLNDVDMAIRPIGENIRGTPNEQGIQQEPLFFIEKRLYASDSYLATYGEPKTVEELKDHHLIAFALPEQHPYADVNWILRLGMPDGKLHEPVFTSNSVECMIEAAKRGMGIVGSYQEMRIIKESSLINILPEIKDKGIRDYIIYPNYLKKDPDIISFKNYLKKSISGLKEHKAAEVPRKPSPRRVILSG